MNEYFFIRGIIKLYVLCAIVDLNSDNLKKIQDVIWDARDEWFNLGLQLNIKIVELKVISTENEKVKSRFREMLLLWLKMTDPLLSWEDLLTALEHNSVRCGDLAKEIRKKFGMPKVSNSDSNSDSASVVQIPSHYDNPEVSGFTWSSEYSYNVKFMLCAWFLKLSHSYFSLKEL